MLKLFSFVCILTPCNFGIITICMMYTAFLPTFLYQCKWPQRCLVEYICIFVFVQIKLSLGYFQNLWIMWSHSKLIQHILLTINMVILRGGLNLLHVAKKFARHCNHLTLLCGCWTLDLIPHGLRLNYIRKWNSLHWEDIIFTRIQDVQNVVWRWILKDKRWFWHCLPRTP